MHKSPQTTNLPEQACREGLAANAITRDSQPKKTKIPQHTTAHYNARTRCCRSIRPQEQPEHPYMHLQHIRTARAACRSRRNTLWHACHTSTARAVHLQPRLTPVHTHRSGHPVADAVDTCNIRTARATRLQPRLTPVTYAPLGPPGRSRG